MNISYKWLKEYVDFDLTPQEVAAALTSCGLEVDSLEEVQEIKGGLQGLYVGKVLTCQMHPNSDHLHITTVDLGKPEPQQIVCGAPNVAAGQKVIVADIGCALYDGDKQFVIKKTKLRGVDSYGMICAEDEIGVGSSHEGIIVLPEDAIVGMPAAEYYHLESDWVIEIDITANRADALSHYGVARDLYAWLVQNGKKTVLHRPNCDKFVVDNEKNPIHVEIENTDACKRYACLSITDCDVKESPKWLQRKLQTIGIRPVNNIVDITNYIMMAYGQPMHCFDADMVLGNKIIVKTLPEGTKFVTLDGEERKLGTCDLSICNEKEPMCIAGIFGGKGSGTYNTTKNVVLESACFHPTWIRKSARKHGISTDASYRFERGVDPNGVIYALKQAAILCKELANGKVSMQINDVYPSPINAFPVDLEEEYVNKLVGKEIGLDTIKKILYSLDIKILEEKGTLLKLLVPTYRVDVQRPCDVVEEILRIYGYNNIEIPSQLKSSLTVQAIEDKEYKLENLISEQLVGAGFSEIMNNSLTRLSYYDSLKVYAKDNTVKIMNPLSSDLGVMRQSLLFGGLESIVRNVNRRCPNLRLFEFGNCYSYDKLLRNEDDLTKSYKETYRLGLWLTGKKVAGSWAHLDEQSSFYELKAYLFNVFIRVGLHTGMYVIEESNNDIFSNALAIKNRGGKLIAEIGVVNHIIQKNFDLKNEVFYAEVDWNLLMKTVRKNKVEFKEICKYPSVSRDLALLLDDSVTFAEIQKIAKQTEKKFLKKVELFDVYQGKNLPVGKKSYAVNFILQDEKKTLNDKQIDSIMEKIIANLKSQLNAELR